MSKNLVLLVCMYAALLTDANTANASVSVVSPDTVQILESIEQHRNKVFDEGLKAARELNAKGDRAYKKKNYRSAYTAYYNSYPNAPNAYAYIMAGDSHWRSVLQYQKTRPLKKNESCRLDNSYFAHDLENNVAQHQSVGLSLAERSKDRQFMDSSLYKRTSESTACLESMIQEYKAKPKTACVDLNQLNNCLGKPLIK